MIPTSKFAFVLLECALVNLLRAAGLFCALVPSLFGQLPASVLTTELSATKRVVTHDAKGRVGESVVPFTKVLPGEEVTYTVVCTNTGAEPAAGIVVDLPIPAEMIVVPAADSPGVEVTCSIDGGKTFDRLDRLRVVAPDGASRPARPADVRFVRWTLTSTLGPGMTAKVNCRALLK